METNVTSLNPTRPRCRSASRPLRDRFGICQWFHYEDYWTLERSIGLLHDLGIRHIRTGVSWADYFRTGGKAWCETLLRSLNDFEVLLSVWHTPPSISEGGHCSSPPRRLLDYADFVDLLITNHSSEFTHLELWNEPNNLYKWNFVEFDPQWRKFAEMIGCAAYWARQLGKPTVLGGMMPVDPHWLKLMEQHGALQYMDKVGIHGFPEMWWEGERNWEWSRDWCGWDAKIGLIGDHSVGRPIWITETGLATWDLSTSTCAKHDLQVQQLMRAAEAPAERTYWYSLIDLDPDRPAIEGFHVDENEYHLGLVTHAGKEKPAYYMLQAMLAEG